MYLKACVQIMNLNNKMSSSPRLAFGIIALLTFIVPKSVDGKVCTSDSVCGVNEVCVFPTLANGQVCQQGICRCQPCFGRKTQTSECSPAVLVMPCERLCTREECNSKCSSNATNEVYPPFSECKKYSRWKKNEIVKCHHCYKPSKGQCVLKRSDNENLSQGSPCNIRQSCNCGPTLDCVGKCACSTGRFWNATARRCSTRRFGDACSTNDDCIYLGGACTAGSCACGSGFSAVRANYLDYSTQQIVETTTCLPENLQTLGIGDVCATLATDLTKSQFPGKCPSTSNTICHACPHNASASTPFQSRCVNFDSGNAVVAQKCPKTSARTSYQPSSINKIGQLCRQVGDCSLNEECRFDSVRPACDFGVCRCRSCYDILDTSYECQPYFHVPLGASCEALPNEKYPIGATCKNTENSRIVSCIRGFTENNGQCQRNVIETGAKNGENCKEDRDCAGNLHCDLRSPVCDCFGGTVWNANQNSCMTTTPPCAACPDDTIVDSTVCLQPTVNFNDCTTTEQVASAVPTCAAVPPDNA